MCAWGGEKLYSSQKCEMLSMCGCIVIVELKYCMPGLVAYNMPSYLHDLND